MNIEMGIGVGLGNKNIGYLDTGSAWDGTSVEKSDVDALELIPTLYAVQGTDTTVDIYFQGGHSDQEDYGVGKHFTLALTGGTGAGESITNLSFNLTRVRCIIATGDTHRHMTMTIVDNKTLELDRNIYIYSPMFGAAKTVTIVDDNIPVTSLVSNIIDASAPNAGLARGLNELYTDGVTNNATRLNAMYTWLEANGGGGIVYIPGNANDYIVSTSIPLPNQSIVGDPANPPVLKMPAGTAITGAALAKGEYTVLTRLTHGVTFNWYLYADGLTETGWSAFNFGGASDLTTRAWTARVIDADTLEICRMPAQNYLNSGFLKITKAEAVDTSTAKLTTEGVHGLITGDKLYFKTGTYAFTDADWTFANGNRYTVTRLSATEFSLDGVDATGKAATATTQGAIYVSLDTSALADIASTNAIKYIYQGHTAFLTTYAGLSTSPLAFKDIILDGNLPNNGPFLNYEFYQAAAIQVRGNTAIADKLPVRYENIVVRNHGGDGLKTYHNTDNKIYEVDAVDVFRGGVNFLGGNCVTQLKNVTTGPGVLGLTTGIDSEVDSPGFGASYRADVTLTDVTCYGDCDIGGYSNSGSVWTVNNLKVYNDADGLLNLGYPNLGGVGIFTDCLLYTGFPNTGGINTILYSGQLDFLRCEFIASSSGTVATSIYAAPLLIAIDDGAEVHYDYCNFSSDGTVDPAIPIWAVGRKSDVLTTESRVIRLTDCEIEATCNGGIEIPNLYLGGDIICDRVNFNHSGDNSCYGIRIAYHATHMYDISLTDCDFTGPFMYLLNSHADCYVRCQGVTLTKAANLIGTSTGYALNKYVRVDGHSGCMRTITGTGVPGTMAGFYNATGGDDGDGKTYDRYYRTDGAIWYRTTAMNTWAAE